MHRSLASTSYDPVKRLELGGVPRQSTRKRRWLSKAQLTLALRIQPCNLVEVAFWRVGCFEFPDALTDSSSETKPKSSNLTCLAFVSIQCLSLVGYPTVQTKAARFSVEPNSSHSSAY